MLSYAASRSASGSGVSRAPRSACSASTPRWTTHVVRTSSSSSQPPPDVAAARPGSPASTTASGHHDDRRSPRASSAATAAAPESAATMTSGRTRPSTAVAPSTASSIEPANPANDDGQVARVDRRRVHDPHPVGVGGEPGAEAAVRRAGLAPARHHDDGAARAQPHRRVIVGVDLARCVRWLGCQRSVVQSLGHHSHTPASWRSVAGFQPRAGATSVAISSRARIAVS